MSRKLSRMYGFLLLFVAYSIHKVHFWLYPKRHTACRCHGGGKLPQAFEWLTNR